MSFAPAVLIFPESFWPKTSVHHRRKNSSRYVGSSTTQMSLFGFRNSNKVTLLRWHRLSTNGSMPAAAEQYISIGRAVPIPSASRKCHRKILSTAYTLRLWMQAQETLKADIGEPFRYCDRGRCASQHRTARTCPSILAIVHFA